MTISLKGIGKRFNREWIFRNINLTLPSKSSCAITGANGSGKSTLIQIISGSLLPSLGHVLYQENGQMVAEDQMYRYLSFCAPYIDVIEDFTLMEFLSFHFKFKKLVEKISLNDLPEALQLAHAKSKKIKDFSTGMRQRVKLGISFYSDTPIILLDEPTTNLDHKGINWYEEQIFQLVDKKTIIVSSNTETEYAFCRDRIIMEEFK